MKVKVIKFLTVENEQLSNLIDKDKTFKDF